MAKNKPSPRREERLLAQPTIYTFNFKDVPVDKYTEVLDVLFHNPDFSEAVEKRNRLVNSAGRLRQGSTEMRSLINTIQQRDRKLADMMYSAMVQANLRSTESYEFLSFTTLLKYYVNYGQDGMKERVDRLARQLDKVTFLADMLESLVTDIKEDMRGIFDGKIEFNQFDAVAQVLAQLRGFFNSVRKDEDSTSPEAQLYMDYADSINEYLDKRLKTYTGKFRKLRPATPAYTEQDMIDALNQFFGTGKLFGRNFIKHTDTGGSYIDATMLALNLKPEQLIKLYGIVSQQPKDSSSDAMMKYSFRVTDAIMSNYKQTK